MHFRFGFQLSLNSDSTQNIVVIITASHIVRTTTSILPHVYAHHDRIVTASPSPIATVHCSCPARSIRIRNRICRYAAYIHSCIRFMVRRRRCRCTHPSLTCVRACTQSHPHLPTLFPHLVPSPFSLRSMKRARALTKSQKRLPPPGSVPSCPCNSR